MASAPVQGLSAGARAGCCSGAERAWHGGADAVAPPGHVAGHRQMPASTRCASSRMAWCRVLLVHVMCCSASAWLACVATEEYQEPQAEHQEPLEAVAAAAVAQAARAVVATMLRDTRSSTYPASRMTALAMGASC